MNVAAKPLSIRDVISSRLDQTNLLCEGFFTRFRVDEEALEAQFDIFLRPVVELCFMAGREDEVACFKDPRSSICC